MISKSSLRPDITVVLAVVLSVFSTSALAAPFQGRWRIDESSATALQGARLHVAFGAQRVFLVLGTNGRVPRRVRVLLDGRRLPDALAGPDVHGGTVLSTVSGSTASSNYRRPTATC